MVLDAKCKKCRANGKKLFLKGDKCFSDKCIMNRRPFPPGRDKSRKQYRKTLSTYQQQLKNKQEIKLIYGLNEDNLKRFYNKAFLMSGSTPDNLAKLLEKRIDTVVFYLGIAKSRTDARQLVSHGHFLVNGKRHDVASAVLNVGSEIQIRPSPMKQESFKKRLENVREANIPKWISFDKNKGIAKIVAEPDISEIGFDFASVVESFS
ncbi:MAG TPA: 30S ribosomal protein S4 [Candidatus Paceibacterota bacterium]|nr:30S ribosomal protein S4 [Candidatus Paceibacterota bacterium]